jgi:cystathionine beta-lyase
MKYDFDEIINRRNTHSVKWDSGELLKIWGITDTFDENTIPLFTADMDIAVPPQIEEAMVKTARQRIYGYSLPMNNYYKAIIDWHKTRYDWTIERDEIVYCPGTVSAIGIAIKAFTNEGDGILIQRPVYTPFTAQIENNKRVVVNNQLVRDEDGYYTINLDEFSHLASMESTKLFILCNPHNPTGRIFKPNVLKRMADICKENNVIIIADEIHGDLIRQDSTFVPIVKTTDKTDHIISCTAINKTFNVAGLHATNIIIENKELRARFKKVLGMAMATPFTINAVITAYTECSEWLDQIKTYLDGTIDWVMAFLKDKMPRVKFQRPEGTYIFWMDFNGYNISVEEIKQRIYTNANVVLEPGKMFDPDLGEGFERICLSSPRPIIKKAFYRIHKAFEDLE